MPEKIVPPRSELPEKYKWAAETVFASIADWEKELKSLAGAAEAVSSYQDKISQSPADLLAALHAIEDLVGKVQRVYFYASMSFSVDTTDQAASRRNSQAQSAAAQAFAAMAYLDPGLIAIGEAKLRSWLAQEPDLQIYTHYIDNLFRRQAHVRSTEVEELLGLAADPFGNLFNTQNSLVNADFKFPPAKAEDGSPVQVTASTFDNLMGEPDRTLRQTAYESYTGVYLGFKNTLASNLAGSIKSLVFQMRARRHISCLEASLFQDNVPEEVFFNLIETFKKHLPVWHRYWAVRRKILGVDELRPYDIWAPLTANRPTFTYEQAVDWVCRGLEPLGTEYAGTIRRGCLEQRWVDVFPNVGKWDGAFSAGAPGTFPFILLNFDNSIFGLSTLTHELGHSMHSYLSWQNQPLIYSNYTTFAAEVASNFHQAMTRAAMLATNPDRDLQISILEEAMSNLHRYFFIMPTLARFELEVYQREERGEGLAADDMIEIMADLFAEGYGSEMMYDRKQIGITWATFPHLYMNFYVFQYATGISGAHAFAKRILSGVPGAAEAYLGFLNSGGSRYPLDALRLAGVDLSTSVAVEETFGILADYVSRLEALAA
jgi:oligoendopeptidase F